MLAQDYRIKRLVLFGSVARGESKITSDIDLMVEFEKDQSPSLGKMIRLKDELSLLFAGHPVDLVMPSILNNPYRRQAIEKDMLELYPNDEYCSNH